MSKVFNPVVRNFLDKYPVGTKITHVNSKEIFVVHSYTCDDIICKVVKSNNLCIGQLFVLPAFMFYQIKKYRGK